MLIEGDPRVIEARPRRCDELWVSADGKRLRIHVGHGAWEAVHHVDVDERSDDVIITAWVGMFPEVIERERRGEKVVYTLQSCRWWRIVELSAPLSSRVLRDGAPELPA